ncbi:MAG: putative flagellar hook-length control protein FliK [Alphaproteobacteria bacterium]|nr:putative flagellar hook-length control protein FliK [Alphaproteobacteria bacterium]
MNILALTTPGGSSPIDGSTSTTQGLPGFADAIASLAPAAGVATSAPATANAAVTIQPGPSLALLASTPISAAPAGIVIPQAMNPIAAATSQPTASQGATTFPLDPSLSATTIDLGAPAPTFDPSGDPRGAATQLKPNMLASVSGKAIVASSAAAVAEIAPRAKAIAQPGQVADPKDAPTELPDPAAPRQAAAPRDQSSILASTGTPAMRPTQTRAGSPARSGPVSARVEQDSEAAVEATSNPAGKPAIASADAAAPVLVKVAATAAAPQGVTSNDIQAAAAADEPAPTSIPVPQPRVSAPAQPGSEAPSPAATATPVPVTAQPLPPPKGRDQATQTTQPDDVRSLQPVPGRGQAAPSTEPVAATASPPATGLDQAAQSTQPFTAAPLQPVTARTQVAPAPAPGAAKAEKPVAAATVAETDSATAPIEVKETQNQPAPSVADKLAPLPTSLGETASPVDQALAIRDEVASQKTGRAGRKVDADADDQPVPGQADASVEKPLLATDSGAAPQVPAVTAAKAADTVAPPAPAAAFVQPAAIAVTAAAASPAPSASAEGSEPRGEVGKAAPRRRALSSSRDDDASAGSEAAALPAQKHNVPASAVSPAELKLAASHQPAEAPANERRPGNTAIAAATPDAGAPASPSAPSPADAPAPAHQSVAPSFTSLVDGPAPTLQQAAAPVHAAQAMPTVSARAGQIGREMGVEIAHRVSLGRDELVVRLDPEQMGRIEIRMAFDDNGTLRAVVHADSPAALDLLRRDSGDLTRALTDAGVRADSQSFRFDGRGGDQPRQQPGQRNPIPFTETGPAPLAEDVPEYRRVRTSGTVDLLA